MGHITYLTGPVRSGKSRRAVELATAFGDQVVVLATFNPQGADAEMLTRVARHRAERPGLCAGRAGWYHRLLDVEAMRAGAVHLAGTHDFSVFRAAECQAKSPVKTLSRIGIAAQPPFVRFDFTANAFLHHMVRNIVGALVHVGAGRQPPDWIAALLEARDRRLAAPTFSADGLYLAGADYDARFGLPPTVRTVAAVLA